MLHNFAQEHIPSQVLKIHGHALAMLLRCLYAMAQLAVAGSHCSGLHTHTQISFTAGSGQAADILWVPGHDQKVATILHA
jgi:hypothetical protein